MALLRAIFLLVLVAYCAIRAVQAAQLLASVLWLAGVSATSAVILFVIGAHTMAVIELSLSLGLVTVLLVFAISMVGANSPDTVIRKKPDLLLVMLVMIVLVTLILPANPAAPESDGSSFSTVLWETRQPDILVQIAMIFAGVMGVLRLLAHRDNVMTTGAAEAEAETDDADKEAVP